MITMKEQADQFRKLLQHMNAPKKKSIRVLQSLMKIWLIHA